MAPLGVLGDLVKIVSDLRHLRLGILWSLEDKTM